MPNIISGKACFRLYDTFGFPFELTKELAKERGYDVDEEGYKKPLKNIKKKAELLLLEHLKAGLQILHKRVLVFTQQRTF